MSGGGFVCATGFVGASLLAKAAGQAMNNYRMYRPLREQARSHGLECATGFVGASLLAKAAVQAMNNYRMYRPLREQARSHGLECATGFVGASLLAKAAVQAMNNYRMYRPLREQARSHGFGLIGHREQARFPQAPANTKKPAILNEWRAFSRPDAYGFFRP